MPIVRISTLKGRTLDEKRAISGAIHEALVDSFRIPERDNNQRIDEYDPQDYILPPGRSEKYILIEITVFPGRSQEAKRVLYRAIVSKLGKLNVDPMDISIILYEPPLENWGIRGGIPASEVDLGFDLNV
jgi:phenylpyruvate tautomerase PptA (4-oxalocrotonate tautomerase family)